MFNIGFTELIILGLIALIFIGPQQLPEVARTVGRLLNEWKRATSDFQNTITTHLTEEVQQRRVDTYHQTDEDFAKHIAMPGAHHESGAGSVEDANPAAAPELPVGAHPVSQEDPEKKS